MCVAFKSTIVLLAHSTASDPAIQRHSMAQTAQYKCGSTASGRIAGRTELFAAKAVSQPSLDCLRLGQGEATVINKHSAHIGTDSTAHMQQH